MTSRRAPAVLAASVLLFGCGGAAASDEDQIREQNKGFVQDAREQRFADACDRTTDPPACVSALARFGEAISELAPSGLDAQIDGGRVAVQGNSATLTAGSEVTRMLKRDGRWLIVYE
jgi:hypothetical protein